MALAETLVNIGALDHHGWNSLHYTATIQNADTTGDITLPAGWTNVDQVIISGDYAAAAVHYWSFVASTRVLTLTFSDPTAAKNLSITVYGRKA